MKILYWDIETLPNVSAHFGMWKQDISPKAVIHTSSMICASWKWEGKKTVHSASIADYPNFKKDVFDDSALVKDLYDVIAEADILVHHNGDSFDVKYMNGRLLANGLPSLPKILTIDTYKVAKSKFRLNYNRLDYLAEVLGLEGKNKVGMELWMRVIQGKREAVAEMVEYNKQDVRVLETVYERLKPFISGHPAPDAAIGICPTCSSDNLLKRGYHYTKTAKRQRYVCGDCGSWCTNKKAIQTAGMKSC